MYVLYLITLFAFIASLIAAVYYFRKYNKLRNRLPGISIDGKQELMKPYSLLMHELGEKQQQLKQQNLQHRLLVKAIKLKLWKWDLKRKEIIWDGDLERDEQGVTVVNADEHLSHVLPEYRKRIYEAIDGLEKGCSKLIDEEFLYQNADNTLSWRNIYGIIYEYDEGGKPAILIGGTQIIDERKKLESDLRKAKDKAEEANRLKTAFLANMSHEIRTPLNAIVGFSELMAYAGEEEKADYIQIINSNNELLLKLINDILDLSKLEAGSVELKYEPFDLSEHFENMFTSMKQRLKNPDIVLTEINPYHCCQVTLDRNRVAQIITNYVTNAIKYTSKGSIKMGYACKDGGVYFYVKDTGIGIADDKKGKVFQRFEKLDEFAQGTGLGLSICKAIAEAMGGKVGFESVHNEGSLFWAFLPCEVDTLSMVEEKKEENISGGEFGANDEVMEKSAGRKTILIAEDIQSNYQLVSTILKDHYDLLHAENGQKAVEIARSQHVDLLLMDMKMPVLDGLKATAEIRKFNASLPIVALTAHAFDSDRIAAIKVGCNEYLVKPLEKMKLMVALKKYL